MPATFQPTKLGIAVLVLVLLAVAARFAGGNATPGGENATPITNSSAK